jgi:acyl-CoA thioesterase
LFISFKDLCGENMTEQSPKSDYGLVEGDLFAEMLGIKLIECKLGYSHLEVVVREDMLNGLGILHGGLVFTLVDTAFAYACNSHGPPTVAATVTIQFIRAVKGAGTKLVAIATEDSLEGKRGLYDLRVYENEPDGKLIALARGASVQL